MNQDSNANIKEVTVIVVTWNSKKFLPVLFQSLESQSYQNFEVIVIDNGSCDETCNYIEKNRPQVKLIKNRENTGFSQANNLGIKMARTPFVLICNPDIILDSNFLSQGLKTAKSDDKIGAVGGKLIKLDSDLNKQGDSATIDSTGIVILKSRRAVDRGESEKDHGQFDQKEEVFGISGALVLYQKAALEKAAIKGAYFDEDFFAYKEDVDLAWRLRAMGFKSVYTPDALAYHRRGVARQTNLTDKGTMINRKKKKQQANYLSYRNHLFLLIKNEQLSNLFFNPHFLWYELKKLIYLLFFEPATLKALFDFYKKLPLMLKKRKIIKTKRVVSSQELNKWFV